jgi:hypothetical protein
MAIYRNVLLNPSAEGATSSLENAAAATVTMSTFAATGWPADGTRSYSVAATATTNADARSRLVERGGATPGQRWHLRARIYAAPGNAATRRFAAYLQSWTAAPGATAGTATTISSSLEFDLPPGTAAEIAITGVAAAGALSVGALFRRIGGVLGSAIGDVFYVDAIALVQSDEVDPSLSYWNPATNRFGAWTGTANASQSLLYSPSVALTPYPDANPCPRVEVLVQDCPPGSTITIRRLAESRSYPVRGAVQALSAGGVSRIDTEVPFGVPAAYQAEVFIAGASIGFSQTATITLDIDEIWVHQPLQPQLAVRVDFDREGSAQGLTRPTEGEVVYTDGASVGRWVGGRRRGLRGVKLGLSPQTAADADEIQAMLGTYTEDQIPVLCIRTPPGTVRLPRTLFLSAASPEEEDINIRYGGTLATIWITGDEVLPPAPGLTTPLLRYQDTDAKYGSYAAIDAQYGTYLARDRDYALAGFAG